MQRLPNISQQESLLCLGLLFAASACFAGPEQRDNRGCVRDQDCPEICSRVGECLTQDEVIEIRASWTIGGQAPTPSAPGPCGSIDALEISLETDDTRDIPIIYYPVPCDIGQVYYDRMSNRLTQMRLSSVASDGTILEVVLRNIEGASSNLQVDFNPQ